MNNYAQTNDTTLFVGNLDPRVNDVDFFSLMSTFGSVLSSKIMKNNYTGESREFGFVVYKKREDAENAFRNLNGTEYFKRNIRVMFKKNIRDLDEKANLMIKEIDKSVTIPQLTDECKKFGKVVSLIIRTDETNRNNSLGYGYVQFETEAEAEKCLAELNGKILNGKQILVERFVNNKNREKTESGNIYMKQFPAEWQKEDIEKFIDTEIGVLGKITSKGVFPKNGSFYAFAAFEKPEEAKKVIEKFNGWKRPDSQSNEALFVGPAMSKRARAKMLSSQHLFKSNLTNLYIRSLKPEVTSETLKKAFEKYGPVTSVLVKSWEPDPRIEAAVPQKKLQFGFINYEKEDDALKATSSYKTDAEIRDLVDPVHTGDFLYYAQPKPLRQQYLRMQKLNQRQTMMMRQQRFQQMNPMGHMGMPHKMRGRGGHGFPMGQPPMMAPPMMGLQAPIMNIQAPIMNSQAPMMNIGAPSPLKTVTPPEIAPVNPKMEFEQKLESTLNNREFCNLIRNNEERFKNIDAAQRKKIIGNVMFRRVKSKCQIEEFVPKITGMLIDEEFLNLKEILDIIENDQELTERINEAMDILKNPDAEADAEADN